MASRKSSKCHVNAERTQTTGNRLARENSDLCELKGEEIVKVGEDPGEGGDLMWKNGV